jgi:hypothetical protein
MFRPSSGALLGGDDKVGGGVRDVRAARKIQRERAANGHDQTNGRLFTSSFPFPT